MAEPQATTLSFNKELWAAFLVTCSIISTLIAVLYNRLNKDINGTTDSLAEGDKRFNRVDAAAAKTDTEVAKINMRLDELDRAIKDFAQSLKEGRAEFEAIGKKLVLVERKLEELASDGALQDEEAEAIREEIRKLHDTLLKMETEHKRNHPGSTI